MWQPEMYTKKNQKKTVRTKCPGCKSEQDLNVQGLANLGHYQSTVVSGFANLRHYQSTLVSILQTQDITRVPQSASCKLRTLPEYPRRKQSILHSYICASSLIFSFVLLLSVLKFGFKQVWFFFLLSYSCFCLSPSCFILLFKPFLSHNFFCLRPDTGMELKPKS